MIEDIRVIAPFMIGVYVGIIVVIAFARKVLAQRAIIEDAQDENGARPT